jgi:predicted dehydrogenase
LIHDIAHSGSTPRNTVLHDSDAIIIATPTTEHWRDIMDCAEMGKPMLIEKPITHPDLETLEKVAYALGTSGVPAFMGFNLRFHACVQKAKEWLPKIGVPLNCQFRVLQKSTRPEYLRDGVISNWLSHEIEVALHLLGHGTIVGCDVDSKDTTAHISIKHENGGRSILYGDYGTDPEIRDFTIWGMDGDLRADLVSRTVTCGKDRFRAEDSFDQNYEAELSSWIKQIKGDHGLCADWTDGVAVERIVIKARELGGLA